MRYEVAQKSAKFFFKNGIQSSYKYYENEFFICFFVVQAFLLTHLESFHAQKNLIGEKRKKKKNKYTSAWPLVSRKLSHKINWSQEKLVTTSNCKKYTIALVRISIRFSVMLKIVACFAIRKKKEKKRFEIVHKYLDLIRSLIVPQPRPKSILDSSRAGKSAVKFSIRLVNIEYRWNKIARSIQPSILASLYQINIYSVPRIVNTRQLTTIRSTKRYNDLREGKKKKKERKTRALVNLKSIDIQKRPCSLVLFSLPLCSSIKRVQRLFKTKEHHPNNHQIISTFCG